MTEVVMYIIVNKDLKMSPGKLAAQVAHSAVKAAHIGFLNEPDNWEEWYKHSYTKIVLKASEYEMKEMIKYANIECISYTYDEGRTEIPKGSLTTIAFIPMPKDDNRITGYIAELKLL